jgi:hypothetical protein
MNGGFQRVEERRKFHLVHTRSHGNDHLGPGVPMRREHPPTPKDRQVAENKKGEMKKGKRKGGNGSKSKSGRSGLWWWTGSRSAGDRPG